jgi:hypothetical protein
MIRNARCCCGSLRVEAAGEPASVVACHCGECQRRSGSPFGVGAYYERDQLRIVGPSTVYERAAGEGRKLRNHFCPTCGTNLFWELDARPNQIGVAVGGFVDPAFPAPTRSVWEERRHGWVAFGHPLDGFAQAVPRRPHNA